MTQDELKLAVAKAAIDMIRPSLNQSDILGIGTGSTANFFIDELAALKGNFKGAVASSEASAERLAAHGISLYNLNAVDSLSVYIDGADESDHNLCLIKGGGAALTREKIVTACAEEFLCIADESKWVDTLGKFPLPVEVVPMSRAYVMRELTKLGGKPFYREGVVTDNGNDIVDVHDLVITQPKELEAMINHIAGVVTNGLFAMRPADKLLLGTEQGVVVKTR